MLARVNLEPYAFLRVSSCPFVNLRGSIPQISPLNIPLNRPKTFSPSNRSALWTNSLVSQKRVPLIIAAVCSAKMASTYMSS